MRAVRIAALALALFPASASAADVTILYSDEGYPRTLGGGLETVLRNMDFQYVVRMQSHDGEYHKISTTGPDGAPAAASSPCSAKSTVGEVTRHLDYHGNGEYAVLVETFTDPDCIEGWRPQRFRFTINAGTALTPPAGVVLTGPTHKVAVAPNPGAGSYEVKYARGGVIGPDGGISGPSVDALVNGGTGLADVRFTEPGRYVMVARAKRGDYSSPWSAPISVDVKAPFDLLAVKFPDSRGPSYKLRGTLSDAFARGSRVTVYSAKGRTGGRFRKLGRSSRINAQGRFTLRFKLRKPGVYRLQYRFRGTSLVIGGKVTKAVRVRR
jgi:hypothetical protein